MKKPEFVLYAVVSINDNKKRFVQFFDTKSDALSFVDSFKEFGCLSLNVYRVPFYSLKISNK